MALSMPSSSSLIKIPHIPTSLASICYLNSFEKSGVENVGSPMRIDLILLKASVESFVHIISHSFSGL